MPKIQQLSPHVADLIAAGEVVERPASAAKELVENAIDAGAKHVTVEIQNGGMTFLRVTDDGCGMLPEDAETAFLRHATSKLRNAEDLEAIHTLGFRGEALAAISSVSRIDLLTKTPGAAFGTSLHLEAGTVTERGEAGCPDGTTIIVRDLFYNTPARMKFMKRDSVEASALLSTVQRLAIAHPEVAIRLLREGEIQLDTPGDGELYSAIYAVFGRQSAQEMTKVESHYEKYTLTGYVSKPAYSRGNRSNQLFFVNGRNIKSKTITAALEDAYRNQLMVGRYPFCVLHLGVPEHLVDVNVHPAKTEVKFLNDRELHDCVYYGVLGALDAASGKLPMKLPEEKAPPRQDFFKTMTSQEYRAFAETLSSAPKPTPGKAVEPILRSPTLMAGFKAPAPPPMPTIPAASPVTVKPISVDASDFEDFDPPAPKPKPESKPAPQPVQQELALPTQEYRIAGEVLNTYIIVEQGDSILLIDKHAAHERILFEKLRVSKEPIAQQLLLQPILMQPEREEAAILLEHSAMLAECGFALSDYGDGTLAVNQIPADVDAKDAAVTLSKLAEDLQNGKTASLEALRDTMLHTVACKAAIKGGWHTSAQEREVLVREVMTRSDLKYCPHGRPICIVMTAAQLERQFKRA